MKALIRPVVLALLIAFVLIAFGCNTTKGAGEDIQNAGQAIQNSAEKHGAD